LQTRLERGYWQWTPFLAYESEDYTDPLGEISFIPARVIQENWRAGFGLRKRRFFTQNYVDIWRSRDRLRPVSSDESKFEGNIGWSHSRPLQWNHAWVDLSAGLQYEWRETDRPEVQPLAGARLFWGPSHRIQFFGIRRVHRFPTFLERFGNQGVIIGNPNLRPESGFHAEYGVTLVRRDAQTQVTVYASRMTHLIYYFQNSQRNFVAQNFARANFYGVEASSQWKWSGRGRLFISATYQRAVAADAGYLSGRDLPNRPHLLYSAFISQFIGATEARFGLTGRVGGYYDAGNLVPIDARLTADFSVFIPISRSFHLSVIVRNIFDDAGLDFIGYPLPGRTVEIALSSRGQE
jgi:outer membrane receptor protein involved in Fe transport